VAEVLDKSPAATFVVIDEVAMEDRGVGGLPVKDYRASLQAASCQEKGCGG
jgi:4-oxalocrotonate tautomerase